MKRPPPHTALGHAATAEAMAGYRRRAWRLLGVGVLATVVVAAGGTAADSVGLSSLSGWAAGALGGVLVLVCLGGVGVLRARRMRRVLAAGPWTACAAEGFVYRDQAPTVVLKDPATGALRPLAVSVVRPRLQFAQPGPDRVLWWCGDAKGRGVLVRPDTMQPVWARPPRTQQVRRARVEAAERLGLAARPAPVQPQVGPAPALAPVVLAKPGAPAPVSAADDCPDYTRLAAAARRQAPPPGRPVRAEADVRRVPWWRVRTLRRASGVLPAAGILVGVLVTVVLTLSGSLAVVDLVEACGVASFYVGYWVFAGLPKARAMAGAARSPATHAGRYVLFPDAPDGDPVLVFFPDTDDPHSRPYALLRLHGHGRGRRRRRRSAAGQVAPVGRCALHGGTQGHRLVVPWIDGRPLWPQGSLYVVNPANQADKVKLQALMSAW